MGTSVHWCVGECANMHGCVYAWLCTGDYACVLMNAHMLVATSNECTYVCVLVHVNKCVCH